MAGDQRALAVLNMGQMRQHALQALFCIAFVVGTHASPERGTPRKAVVGILSSPLKLPGAAEYGNVSWIWSTYVDALRDAGVEVVPLLLHSGLPALREALEHVDAALLTGGSDDAGVHGVNYPDEMMESMGLIYEKALAAHGAGHAFPLWGTCQGFQALCVLAASDPSVIVPTFGTEFESLPLDLTPAAETSRLLGAAPPCVRRSLTTRNATLNFHAFGVLASSFGASTRNEDEPVEHVKGFRLLATDVDAKGQRFASMMEHVDLPIFGTQFHPEIFDFIDEGITPSHPAQKLISANEYLMRVFASEAAKAATRVKRVSDTMQYVTGYPENALPVSILGAGFSERFPGRQVRGYIFDGPQVLSQAQLSAKIVTLSETRVSLAALDPTQRLQVNSSWSLDEDVASTERNQSMSTVVAAVFAFAITFMATFLLLHTACPRRRLPVNRLAGLARKLLAHGGVPALASSGGVSASGDILF